MKDKIEDLVRCTIMHLFMDMSGAFIFENVKKITSHKGGRTWKVIMNTLTTMNKGAYHVEWKVLDTQEHGVPQSRTRVYIVGVLKVRGIDGT